MEGESPRKIPKLDDVPKGEPPKSLEALVKKVIAIPLIVDEIFKLLPTSDLLTCSLVNRQWNETARSIIRKHRICYVTISETNGRTNLQDLVSILDGSSTHPFNGFSVSTELPYRFICAFGDFHYFETFQNLLDRVHIKNLKIAWSEHAGCHAVGLIRRILLEYASTVEYLYVERMPPLTPRISRYFGYTSENRKEWFSNLKKLQLKPIMKHTRLDLFEDLLASAPNLTELVGSACPKNVDLILRQNKFGAIKQFDVVRLYKFEDLSIIARFAALGPRLTKLTLSGFRFLNDETLGPWLETAHALWTASQSSLEEVEVNHLDLILLSESKVPPLPRVRTLIITFDIRLVKYDGQPKLRNIDFSRIFPNLQYVRVHPDFDEPSKFKDMCVSNKLMDTDTRFSCPSVTTFELIIGYDEQPSRVERLDPSLHWTVILSIAKIFPKITNFTVRGCPEVAYFCEALWTCWKELEVLNFTSVRCSSSFHVDPCIIGISEIEWKYWKEIRYDLDFDKLQFAPIRTSLRSCTKLKKLRIEFTHRKDSCRPFQSTLLTELAGACAFSRLPNLTVEIVRSKCNAAYNIEGVIHEVPCSFALETLEPYVNFYDREPEESIHPRESLCSFPF